MQPIDLAISDSACKFGEGSAEILAEDEEKNFYQDSCTDPGSSLYCLYIASLYAEDILVLEYDRLV
jgi:hypothetical protein